MPNEPTTAREPAEPAPQSPPRLIAALGLCGAALVLILSLSAFVVGSQNGRSSGSSVGQIAPDFSLRDTAERRVTLRQFEGKPLVLLFTDGDVGRAEAQVETAVATLRGNNDDVRVVAVCQDATPSRAKSLGECVAGLSGRLGQTVVGLIDTEDSVADRYAVAARPEVVVVGANGVILDRGPSDAALSRLPRTLAGKDPSKSRTTLASR